MSTTMTLISLAVSLATGWAIGVTYVNVGLIRKLRADVDTLNAEVGIRPTSDETTEKTEEVH